MADSQKGLDSEKFANVFQQVFGPKKGRDLRFTVTITPEESASGGSKNISIPRIAPCHACESRGGPRTTCPMCRGKGTLGKWRRLVSSLSNKETGVCHKCDGTGIVCSACGNTQEIIHTTAYTIHFPPGVQSGWSHCITGEGCKGWRDNPAGDLCITIHINETHITKE